MADAEAVAKLIIPGGLTGCDGALQRQALAAAERLKNVPDEAVRNFLRRAHGGNPSFRMVSSASGIFMLSPSSVDRQPG